MNYLSYRKFSSSGIAEFVIALSLISFCIAIAATIYVRSLSAVMRFSELGDQTDIQSQIYLEIHQEDWAVKSNKLLNYTVDSIPDSKLKNVHLFQFTGADQRVLWRQQMINQ